MLGDNDNTTHISFLLDDNTNRQVRINSLLTYDRMRSCAGQGGKKAATSHWLLIFQAAKVTQ